MRVKIVEIEAGTDNQRELFTSDSWSMPVPCVGHHMVVPFGIALVRVKVTSVEWNLRIGQVAIYVSVTNLNQIPSEG